MMDEPLKFLFGIEANVKTLFFATHSNREYSDFFSN